ADAAAPNSEECSYKDARSLASAAEVLPGLFRQYPLQGRRRQRRSGRSEASPLFSEPAISCPLLRLSELFRTRRDLAQPILSEQVWERRGESPRAVARYRTTRMPAPHENPAAPMLFPHTAARGPFVHPPNTHRRGYCARRPNPDKRGG